MDAGTAQRPRWVIVYHSVFGSLLLSACVALGLHWPEAMQSPGYGTLALYPDEVLAYTALSLTFGLWLLLTALGMSRRRAWGFWWARALHVLVVGFAAAVACPFIAYGLFLVVFNPHPGGSRWLDFSDRSLGVAIVMGCFPALLLAALSGYCWTRLRGGHNARGLRGDAEVAKGSRT
jgi:hypothetical protein